MVIVFPQTSNRFVCEFFREDGDPRITSELSEKAKLSLTEALAEGELNPGKGSELALVPEEEQVSGELCHHSNGYYLFDLSAARGRSADPRRTDQRNVIGRDFALTLTRARRSLEMGKHIKIVKLAPAGTIPNKMGAYEVKILRKPRQPMELELKYFTETGINDGRDAALRATCLSGKISLDIKFALVVPREISATGPLVRCSEEFGFHVYAVNAKANPNSRIKLGIRGENYSFLYRISGEMLQYDRLKSEAVIGFLERNI